MSDETWSRIGTVELLRQRVYPIDPRADGPLMTWIVVEPGIFPVWRHYDTIRWFMDGKLSERNEKLGDGLYTVGGSEVGSGPTVTFPTRAWGIEEFRDFIMSDPVCLPGPGQRLKFRVTLDNA